MNNHEQFVEYYKDTKLSESKKKLLLIKRNILKNKIEQSFIQKGRKKPVFIPQGSFAMKTIINSTYQPYDIDYGVCINYDDILKNDGKWKTPITVYGWLHDILSNHTDNGAKKRDKCLRVIYTNEDIQYHVDLPCYVKNEEKYYVADKSQNQWIESHPKEISQWFVGKNKDTDDQLRRIIVYFKAWKDYLESSKLIGGFQLTVLACNYFVPIKGDDEKSFVKTVERINTYIQNKTRLDHPIVGSAIDLFENYTSESERFNKIREEFQNLYNKSIEAYNADTNIESAELWQEIFGEKFELPEDEDENVGESTVIYQEKQNSQSRGGDGAVAVVILAIGALILGGLWAWENREKIRNFFYPNDKK